MSAEVHLDRALGRKVRDRDGRVVGRLEEVRAERQGQDYVVTEYLIGKRAFLERLGVESVQRHGGGVARSGYRAWWHQLDLTDPHHPRLTCSVDDLRND